MKISKEDDNINIDSYGLAYIMEIWFPKPTEKLEEEEA